MGHNYAHEAYGPIIRWFLPTQIDFRYSVQVKNAESVNKRVKMLRSVLADTGLDGYIVPSSDPHGGEYVSAHFQARAWLSGFKGSAGTVALTADAAGLWTDSRYYLEAARVLEGTPISLFRMQEPDVPSITAFLSDALSPGSRVGVPRHAIGCTEFDRMQAELAAHEIVLEASDDLVGSIWDDRPPLQMERVVAHPCEFAGQTRADKLARVRRHMQGEGADVYLISSLDDIAWLMNLRGSDISYNPVFLSYAVLTADKAWLYAGEQRLDADAAAALAEDGVEVREYEDVAADLTSLTENRRVLFAADRACVALRDAMAESAQIRTASDITTKLKARKNPTEQAGIRAAMERDGVAMVRFLMWLEQAVATGEVTELSAAAQLREFRAMGERFVGDSFTTISGFAEHGAIVHYSADEETQATLGEGVYLIDSGGQYLDGTTDITRTVAFGTVPDQAKADFTTVLRAHIALAEARFPTGTNGAQLDMLARSVMWAEGANYGHGTGHGVGCYLNVHEGPQRIAPRGSEVALEEGMLSSNEPGLYRAGQWGIRLENLVLVTEAEQTDFGQFHRFETVTLCPVDLSLLDASRLRPEELQWLNRYHAEVFARLSSRLEPAERAWLTEKTRAVTV